MPILKPFRRAQLNRGHPLVRGLVGAWLLNEGGGNSIYDSSGGNLTLTATGSGGLPTWGPGPDGSILNFDDSKQQYYQVSKCPIASYPFTIACWFKSDDMTLNQGLVALYYSGSVYYSLMARGASSGDRVGATASNTAEYSASSAISYTANKWHFAVGIWHSDTLREVYLDGGNKGTNTNNVTFQTGTNKTYIGTTKTSSYWLSGAVKLAYIWNRVLTTEEIQWLYREPFAMFERVLCRELLYTSPAGIWLAGSAEAQSATSAALKQLRRIVGSAAAQSQGSALCKITRKVSATAAGTAYLYGILTLSTRLPWFAGSLETERPWLREVLFNCVSANAFKFGTVLTGGWFWVRVSGCSAIYRGAGMEQIDFTNILAIAAQDAREIWPPSYLLHNSNSTYFYVVRRFNNCGYRECTLSAAVEVSIDAGGEPAKPQSNNIFCSKTEQMDGNKIHLVWFYCPLEQKSKPKRFKIYWDGRTGQIDYESPIAIVNYEGRRYYSYETIALEAGRYLFAIRVEDAYGVENSSLSQLKIDMCTDTPDSISILSAETV